jgi:hypothetical protein
MGWYLHAKFNIISVSATAGAKSKTGPQFTRTMVFTSGSATAFLHGAYRSPTKLQCQVSAYLASGGLSRSSTGPILGHKIIVTDRRVHVGPHSSLVSKESRRRNSADGSSLWGTRP